MTWSLVVAAVFAQQPVPDRPATLWSSELSAAVGVIGSGFPTSGGRVGDGSLTPTLTGRLVTDVGFLVEGGALLTAPFSNSGPYVSLSLAARVGWTWTRFALAVGAVMQLVPAATPPLLVLPTLRAHWQFLPFLGASFGVFDSLGLVPVHLSAELGPFPFGRLTVGYVGPLGAQVGAELPLTPRFGLRINAFYYRIPLGPAPAEFAMFCVGGTLGGGR
jgi:hypothetical protein